MPYGNGFDDFVTDPDFSTIVELFRGGMTDSDGDGRGELDFEAGAPETLRLNLRSPDATDWDVAPTGPVDDIEWRVLSQESQHVTDGDRVRVDMHDGEGVTDYKVVETTSITFDGERLRWGQLVPDDRGHPADRPDGTGSDGTDTGSGSDDDVLIRSVDDDATDGTESDDGTDGSADTSGTASDTDDEPDSDSDSDSDDHPLLR